MERTIGIFNNDSQVVKAVEALEAHGFGAEAVRVIAGNSDQAQRVHTDTDIPVDRLYENERRPSLFGSAVVDDERRTPTIPFGLLGATYLVNPSTPNAPGSPDGYPAPVLGAASLEDADDAMAKEQLVALGLGDYESSQCLHHIEHGDLLVVVDSDRTGRPYAELALREGGALDIL